MRQTGNLTSGEKKRAKDAYTLFVLSMSALIGVWASRYFSGELTQIVGGFLVALTVTSGVACFGWALRWTNRVQYCENND
jgi:hypothetical protein